MRHFIWVSVLIAIFTASAATAQTATRTADPVAVEALIEALEDPATREQLIEALRTPADGAGAPTTGADTERPSLAARFALSTQAFVSDLFQETIRVFRDVGRLSMIPELLTTERRARIADEGLDLLLTVLTTIALYRAFRAVSRRIQARRFTPDTQEPPTLSALTAAFLGQLMMRVLSVLVAWIVGYGLGTSLFSHGDGIALTQALYLNAFLIVGLFSVLLSVFASHHPHDITFANLPIRTEATIYRTIRRVFGLLTYGLVAAAPIAMEWFNFVVARSVRTTVVTIGALAAIYAVARISAVLRIEKARAADQTAPGADDSFAESIASTSITVWGRIWPWFGYGYVAVSYGPAITTRTKWWNLSDKQRCIRRLA